MSTENKTEGPRFSEKLIKLHSQLGKLRNELNEASTAADRVQDGVAQDLQGMFCCGMIVLYGMYKDAVAFEIQQDDAKRGKHLVFASRGIGLDMCPGCFVCGATVREPGANDYLHNIAAFVKSREDGQEIATSFFGGRARVDSRVSEPHRIQVKVGACTAHLPNLQKLDALVSLHNVLRKADVVDAMTYREAGATE